MSEQEKLTPCPFCGATHQYLKAVKPRLLWHVRCGMCGTEGPGTTSKEGSIAAWNSRPEEDRLRAEVAEKTRLLARALMKVRCDIPDWIWGDNRLARRMGFESWAAVEAAAKETR